MNEMVKTLLDAMMRDPTPEEVERMRSQRIPWERVMPKRFRVTYRDPYCTVSTTWGNWLLMGHEPAARIGYDLGSHGMAALPASSK
jgi:hypothetical protein